ncbi:MAG TPA: tetratricopeptide repeat protein, partial [Gillisia sp.]|nr:tetratricopeptide repeat protein [Gillisia sp.]
APEEKKSVTTIAENKPVISGGPLEFTDAEEHSVSDWLKHTSAKPVIRASEDDRIRERKFELIDDFISKSPKINPAKPVSNNNIARDQITAPEALMTETLARVYMEQKNYKKAIQAYKILILKNPEKSGFFADQIRAIKKLQENNTGKE